MVNNQELHEWFRGLSIKQKQGVKTRFGEGANHMRDKDRYGLEALLEEPCLEDLTRAPQGHRERYDEPINFGEAQLPNFRPSGFGFNPINPGRSTRHP